MAAAPATLRVYGPGLLLTSVAVLVSITISALAGPALGALTVAVVLGAVLANVRELPAALSPGLRLASRTLLRAGVVLIATGTAVCGASAIAAMSAVLPGKDEDIDDGAAVAIASVTLYGTVALITFPFLMAPLGLDDLTYGAWVGSSVHEVGQVVAAAAPVARPGPESAIIVKLTRVLLLAPLVAVMAWQFRRAAPDGTGEAGKAPSPVPPFLLGFIALVLLGSWVDLPERFLDVAGLAKDALLAAAMFGLGTGVVVSTLIKQGRNALLLGGISSVFIAVVALIGVRIVAG